MNDIRKVCAAVAIAAAAVLFAGSSALADGHSTTFPADGHVTGAQSHDAQAGPATPQDGHAL